MNKFFQFRLNYSILEPDLPLKPLDTLIPILNHSHSERTFQATFKKDCGDDDVCQSQLEIDAELDLAKKGTDSLK